MNDISRREPPIVNTIIIAVNTGERDRLFAHTVRSMRQGLGITVPELSRASSIPCPNIEAIEAGATMTHAEHHDLAVALSWLSSIHAATALATSPKAAPGLGPALAWLDTVDCALSDRCSAALLRRAVAEVGVAPQDDVKAAQHRDVADVGLAHRRADPASDLVVFATNAHGVP